MQGPSLSPPSVIHCHDVAPIQPWLSYLCWFMRCLRKIWDCISKLPNQSFLTSLIEKIIKENWKQKCKVLFDSFWKKKKRKNKQTKQIRAGVVSYPYLWPWHAWTLSVYKPAVSSLSLSNGRIVNMNLLDNVTVTQRENSKWWRDSKRERGEQKKMVRKDWSNHGNKTGKVG